jgi:putative methionine-R-sulfoxide reductase with GAF domain
MSFHKKLFLSYLLVIGIISGILLLVEWLMYPLPRGSYRVYVTLLLVLSISVSISYLLSRAFSSPVERLFDDLRKTEEVNSEGMPVTVPVKIEGVSRKLRESEQQLNILFEIGKLVSSLLHVQDVLDAIVGLLTREFQLDACSIRLLDEDGNLRIKSYKGLSKAFVETATRKPTVDSYSGEVFLTGKIIIINDAGQIDKPISTTLLVGEDIQSFAVAPIQVEGKIIGVLVTASKNKDYFHERFNDVIYTVANQIGTAIRISQLYDEIYQFSQELERKVQERTQRLEEKAMELVEAEKLAALGKIANRVADECRNSLTVVGGFARRLYENAPDTDPDKEYLGIIMKEVKVLEDKVSEIVRINDK